MPSYTVMTRSGVAISAETPEAAIALAEALDVKEAATEKRARRASLNGHAKATTDHTVPSAQTPAAVSRTEQLPIPAPSPPTSNGTGWMPSPLLARFYVGLDSQQQGAIRALAMANGSEVSFETIAAAAGIASNREVSILLGACARAAKRAGLEWSDVAQFRIQGARHERRSLYRAGPLLRGEGTG